MDNRPHLMLKLPDRSYSSIVKKEIRKVAEQANFTSYRMAEIDIIVSEMISNLNKHSQDGELLVKCIETLNNGSGLEIISIDRGPGMANIKELLYDGRSTTRTLGHGLGAIKRLSDDFDIYSIPMWGTVVLSRVFANKQFPTKERELLTINVVMLSKPGQEQCGDGWKICKTKHKYKLMVLDGLGHGPEAANAVKEAINYFIRDKSQTPADTIKEMHREIKSTRGAVGMAFFIDELGNSISFTGLGNIAARIFSIGHSKNWISYNGIIGHSIPNTLNSNVALWQRNDTIIINSDGLKSRWDLTHLPGILDHDGSVLAAALYKDFSRNNDDLVIVVLKNKK